MFSLLKVRIRFLINILLWVRTSCLFKFHFCYKNKLLILYMFILKLLMFYLSFASGTNYSHHAHFAAETNSTRLIMYDMQYE